MKLIPSLILCLSVFSSLHAYKDHEIWWEQCIGEDISIKTFTDWLGGINAATRVAMRKHVRDMGYTSILDVPCGVCADYYGFKQDGMKISYQGLDITPKLVAFNTAKNIPVTHGSIENIPYTDEQYDMCYARHILEHLEGYEKALLELIRVARKEVFVTFFINPDSNTEMNLEFYNGNLLYHNKYNKNEIEKFVVKHPKVQSIEWVDMGSETILHIYLEHN